MASELHDYQFKTFNKLKLIIIIKCFDINKVNSTLTSWPMDNFTVSKFPSFTVLKSNKFLLMNIKLSR